jgi:threonine/homoserine/homoserine lactone efflux protein
MFDSQFLAFIIIAAGMTVTSGADARRVFRNVLRGNRSDAIATVTGIG